MVDIKSKVIPAQPRSKNYPTGTVVVKGGGGNTTVVNQNAGSIIKIVKSLEDSTFTENNVLSSLRTLLEIRKRIIAQTDNETVLSDDNAFSSLRTMEEVNGAIEEVLKTIEATYLSKTKADTANKLITFIEGLISKGLITAEGGIKLPSGAALYSAYTDGLLSFAIDENGFVIYERGTANKWSVITHAGAEFQNLVIKFLAQITDLEVLNKATTLDLAVQALAKTYNLTVDNTADIMHGIIREYLTSESFVSGFLGSGFKIWKDANGDWNGEFDKLTVRKIFTIFELVVQKVVHQGGMVIRSAAGGKLVKVTDGGTYWKCEHDSTDDFLLDDQVLCQTFTGVTVKRYWRKVTSAGAGYFNLSKTDCEAGSAIPEVGDNVAVLGNRTNTDRQSAQIDCAVGVDAPYRDDYAGINSYSLVGKLINRTGNLSGITDPDFGVLSGSGLIGMNAYLKGVFRLKSSGKLVEDAISDAQSESNAYTDGKITTVETNFEIREGQISSKVTQATTAATQASGYATSAQGSASTASTKASEAAGSASTATTKATAASNSANAAAGSATTAGQKAADAAGSATAAQDAADDAATILSQVTTKESSINQTASNITLQVSEVTTKVTTATNAANTATTKAGEASTSATNAANSANQASNILTTVVQKETSINQTAQEIELKAVRAESAAGRAESAEASINLKADGIVLQASSQAAQSAVNGVQIGGRNLLLNSEIIITPLYTIDYDNATYYEDRTCYLEAGVQYIVSGICPSGLTWTSQHGAYGSTNAVLWLRGGNGDHYIISSFSTGTTGSTFTVSTSQIYTLRTNVYKPGQYTFSKIKIEKGNKATDWAPAPEDVTSDAQAKADAAKSAAISTASSDATAKANTAESNAKTYSNNTFTTKTEFSSQLSVLNNSISAKVSQTDFNSLSTRVSSAEAKITPDAINLTVRSQITTAVNDVQIGGRNLLIGSSNGNGWSYDTRNGTEFSINRASTGETGYIYSGYFQLQGNQVYTLSFESKEDAKIISRDLFILSDAHPSNNAILTWGFAKGVDWHKVIITFTTGSQFNGVDDVRLRIDHNGSSDGSSATIYVRNIKLEKGNKATDWAPAPEDVDASIALRPTTEEIKSQFTIDSSGISMMGKKIALTGLITFSSLASDAQTKITSAQSTAESALANAGTANQSIGTLQNSLGAMAYQNMVSLAKLDSTIVEGGYFKTSLIDANAIITGSLLAAKIAATDITTSRLTVGAGARIGDLYIYDGGLNTNQQGLVAMGENYMGLSRSALSLFYNNYSTQGAGWSRYLSARVAPGSLSVKCVTSNSNFTDPGLQVEVSGNTDNTAINLIAGFVSGFKINSLELTYSATLNKKANSILLAGTGTVTLTLPIMTAEDHGYFLMVKNVNGGTKRLYTASGQPLVTDADTWIAPSSYFYLESVGDAMIFIYYHGSGRSGYSDTGKWVQWKNPRNW